MMAQLFLSNRQGSKTGEVLAVLPDGAYPGFKVVENQDPVAGWNSRPKPNYHSIHIPGADVSEFDDMLEPDTDPVTGLPNPNVVRRLVVDFLPAQASDIARERTLTIPNSNALRRKPNPGI